MMLGPALVALMRKERMLLYWVLLVLAVRFIGSALGGCCMSESKKRAAL
jgi:hypothetical protein